MRLLGTASLSSGSSASRSMVCVGVTGARTPTGERRYARGPGGCADPAGGYTGRHIAGRIQRGGGTGPVKPRQPLRPAGRETVPIPSGSNVSLGDVAEVSVAPLKPSPQPGGGFFIDGGREA